MKQSMWTTSPILAGIFTICALTRFLPAASIPTATSDPRPWPNNCSLLDPSAHSIRAYATEVALVSHVSGPLWVQTSEPEFSTDSLGPESLHRASPQFRCRKCLDFKSSVDL